MFLSAGDSAALPRPGPSVWRFVYFHFVLYLFDFSPGISRKGCAHRGRPLMVFSEGGGGLCFFLPSSDTVRSGQVVQQKININL